MCPDHHHPGPGAAGHGGGGPGVRTTDWLPETERGNVCSGLGWIGMDMNADRSRWIQTNSEECILINSEQFRLIQINADTNN